MTTREVFLTLADVENSIRTYERKYGVSSAQFLQDQNLRTAMPEDDIFKWEAFLDHKRALREFHEELHREYLKQLSQPTEERAKGPTPDDQVLLAA